MGSVSRLNAPPEYNGPMSGYPDMALTAFGDKSAVGLTTRPWCLVVITVRTAAVPRFLLAKIKKPH